ncbi:MAG TPA: helix-turn-helix transcriptional regulator [Pyrinomonadaceae bacterium]|nr:helix-turn-helix transcriptional regulator [Pyrinomonadaceae bacterium]
MATRSPEPLGDFVRRIRNKKGLSLKDVADQSGRFGPPIASSYVSRIENDPTRKPTAVALRKLAHGLGIPPEDLLARAAGLIDPGIKSDELHLLSRFRELSQERRDDVMKIVDMWHSEEIPRRTPRRKSA